MPNLTSEDVLVSGISGLDTGLLGLYLSPADLGAQVFSVSGGQGGVQGYALGSLGLPLVPSLFSGPSVPIGADAMAFVEFGGREYLTVGQTAGGSVLGVEIMSGALLGVPQPIVGLQVDAGRVQGLETVSVNAQDAYVYLSTSDGITRVTDALGQSRELIVSGSDFGALAQVELQGTTFLLAASPQGASVTLFEVTPSGDLVVRDTLGAAQGLGLNAPSAIEVVEIAGKAYAIVAGAGSGTLSVIGLDATEGLTVVDHVIDTLETRFAGVTALETVTRGDAVFVLAGGSDDGLTLFSLAPDGQLVLLDKIEDGADTSLQNVRDIKARETTDGLDIFAISETEAGISRLSADLGAAGSVLLGNSADNVMNGTQDDDQLAGGAGNDTIYGRGGADIVLDGAGRDLLFGGGGPDIFVPADDGQADEIGDFVAGADTIDLSAYANLATLSQVDVHSTATGARLTFDGEVLVITNGVANAPLTEAQIITAVQLGPDRPRDGTDPAPQEGETITGTNGRDRLEGTDRADIMLGFSGSDVLNGRDGDDWLDGGGDGDRVYGNQGDDVLIGGAGRDTLYAGTGDDRVEGNSAADTAFLGAGRDTYTAGENAGAAGDTVYGEDGIDLIQGAAGNDVFFGGTGQDRLHGEAGDDRLTGGAQSDTLYGGEGNDRLAGEGGHDRIEGGAGFDLIFAGDGDDVVIGGFGRDTAHLGAGADLYQDSVQAGFLAADTVYAGEGHDRILFEAGNDAGFGGAGDDFLSGAVGNDRLFGGLGGDTIVGGEGSDRIAGEGGADQLMGNKGDDMIWGGDGADMIWGGNGEDRIFAGAGDDWIAAGDQRDTMTGGGGADVFAFRPGNGSDEIADFERGTDTLRLADQPGGFASLQMTQEAQGLRVSYDGGDILLTGITGPLSQGDFDFV